MLYLTLNCIGSREKPSVTPFFGAPFHVSCCWGRSKTPWPHWVTCSPGDRPDVDAWDAVESNTFSTRRVPRAVLVAIIWGWFYPCSCPKWSGQMCFFTLSGQKQHSLSWALAQMWFRIISPNQSLPFLSNIVKVWPAWPFMRSVWASALDKARPNNPSSAMNSRRGA